MSRETYVSVQRMNRDIAKLDKSVQGAAARAIAATVSKKFILASFDNAEVIPYTIKSGSTIVISMNADNPFMVSDMANNLVEDAIQELGGQLKAELKGVVK